MSLFNKVFSLFGLVQPSPAEIQKREFISTMLRMNTRIPLADALTALTQVRQSYPEGFSPHFDDEVEHYRSHDLFSIINVEIPVMFIFSGDNILTPMTGERSIRTGFTINYGTPSNIFLIIGVTERRPNMMIPLALTSSMFEPA
jgi:hypothetical protein